MGGVEPVPLPTAPTLGLPPCQGLGASSQPQGSRDQAELLRVLLLTGVSWVAGLLWLLCGAGCPLCSPHLVLQVMFIPHVAWLSP